MRAPKGRSLSPRWQAIDRIALFAVCRAAALTCPSPHLCPQVGGQPHIPVFRCTFTLPPLHQGRAQLSEAVTAEGTASSKRDAEHQAALAALKQLKGVAGLRWPEMSFEPHKHQVLSFAQEEAELAEELGTAGQM